MIQRGLVCNLFSAKGFIVKLSRKYNALIEKAEAEREKRVARSEGRRI